MIRVLLSEQRVFGPNLPEQVDGDLHRDDPALLDVVVNELPKLGPLSGSLRPQQIPS